MDLCGTCLFLLNLVLVSLFSYGEASFLPSVFWTTTNTKFISSCPTGCVFQGLHINLKQMTKVNIICPNPGIILKQINSNMPNDLLHENFIMVEKEDFYACRYDSSKPWETTRIIKNCTHDSTGPLQYISVAFQQFNAGEDFIRSFLPGETYYFISTSDGTKDSLVNNEGPGHCNDSKNSLAMKLSVYVCKDAADCSWRKQEEAACDCQPSSTVLVASPTPSLKPFTSSAVLPKSIHFTSSAYNKATRTVISASASSSKYLPTSSTSVEAQKGRRTTTEGEKSCILWLVVVILVLICSLIANMVLYVKYKGTKTRSASVEDVKTTVIPNPMMAQPDSESPDNKKGGMPEPFIDGHKNNFYRPTSNYDADCNGYPLTATPDTLITTPSLNGNGHVYDNGVEKS